MPKIFPTAAAELTAARQIMSGLCETFDLEVLIQALVAEYERECWCGDADVETERVLDALRELYCAL